MKFGINVNMKLECISGWAIFETTLPDNKEIVATLIRDDIEEGRVSCNFQRDDIKNLGIHDTGECGFRFYADEYKLKLGNIYKVVLSDGEETVSKRIVYGDIDALRKEFDAFEITPRNDFSIMEFPAEDLFPEGFDLIAYKKLLIRLRRGKRAHSWRGKFKGHEYPYSQSDWSVFRECTEKNILSLFTCLSTRSLWSIIDTFVDYAENEERLAALSLSNMMYQERFSQTLHRVYDMSEKDSPLLEGQYPYWGGMKSNRLLRDDSYDVFLTKNLECLGSTPLIKSFFIEIFLRSIDEPNSIISINAKYSEFFTEMISFYRRFMKKDLT